MVSNEMGTKNVTAWSFKPRFSKSWWKGLNVLVNICVVRLLPPR